MPHTSVATDAGIGYSCHELTGYREFREAAALYARVFAYSESEYTLNTNLLTALARNGGSAVGAFASDGRLIGFAYGFAGRDGRGADYHYSQAAAVDQEHQGRGVGQALKLAQRDVALRWGQRTMRWTFDPLLARNAHFNLSSLGAVGIAFERDYYARPDTDRLVVSWDLTAVDARRDLSVLGDPPALGRADWGYEAAAENGSWIGIPLRADLLSSMERSEVRRALDQTLTVAFRQGEVLVAASRIDEHTAAYRAIPGKGAP
ncbi:MULTISPECIES: GNAT family N-acetyltransferase [unclassified Microbacterium]|uniref:GNAT family N-acetyltransferase n=1 Tax=unclassified Microbacterium TaxID=2609290 RepID=UPI0015FEE652|nr:MULTISPECIES: GNAT family N-acetyltransferase [unclassified Microbacterium]MBT2486260.1 GNAT family N-acetyltransferase [Microbacterium sp. ISL-108]